MKNKKHDKELETLRRIVRQAYLHVLDNCQLTGRKRLTAAEERQLGRDLATYGTRQRV